MANIQNLQMWNDICTDVRIQISKSLFGMKTTATYKPTNSIINVSKLEYSPQDGEHLRNILSAPRATLSSIIGEYRPKPIVNGNYVLEVCRSRDDLFVCLLLTQYQQLKYKPVTDTLFFEGEEAQTICQLFQ